MTTDVVQVVLRLSKSVLKRVDHIGIEWDTYRTETVERMLNIAADKIEQEGRKRPKP